MLLDAQAAGMTWAEIGGVYGVSRQAAHRRFSDDTVVPADFFDALLRNLDEPGPGSPGVGASGEQIAAHRRVAIGGAVRTALACARA